MSRCGYLWGTKGKEYCELGRSEKLDELLTSLGAANTALALDETKRMLFGFNTLDGFIRQWDRPLAVRYSPMHLYKRNIYVLQKMNPFAAICVNGIEATDSSKEGKEARETIYSYLTVMDQKEVLNNEKYSYIDQIFGTRLLKWQDEDNFKTNPEIIDFDEKPKKVKVELLPQDRNFVFGAVAALFADVNQRVIIRLKEKDNFNARSMQILSEIYSLLPSRMAMETGFASYEKPENIIQLAKDVNIRVFVVPGEVVFNEQLCLPEKSLVINLADENFSTELLDEEMLEALTKWAELGWDERCSAMAVCFTDRGNYFKKEYYLEETKKFFENPFWAFLKEEKEKFAAENGDSFDTQYDEAKYVFKSYLKYDICKKIPWARKKFAEAIPDMLMAGHTIDTLRQAVVRKCTESGDESQNVKDNCIGLRNWLNELESKDDSFECAKLVALDTDKKITAKWQKVVEQKESQLQEESSNHKNQVIRLEEESRQKLAAAEQARIEEVTNLKNYQVERDRQWEQTTNNIKQVCDEQLKEKDTQNEARVQAVVGEYEEKLRAKHEELLQRDKQWEDYSGGLENQLKEAGEVIEKERAERADAIDAAVKRRDEEWQDKTTELRHDYDEMKAYVEHADETLAAALKEQEGKHSEEIKRLQSALEGGEKGRREYINSLQATIDEQKELIKNSQKQLDEFTENNTQLEKENQHLYVRLHDSEDENSNHKNTISKNNKLIKILKIVLAGAAVLALAIGFVVGFVLIPKKVSVPVEVINEAEGVSFQWQEKNANNEWTDISEKTKQDLVIEAKTGKEDKQYRCVVTTPEPVKEIPLTMTVESNNPNSTYQWQKKVGDGDWQNIEGETLNTLIAMANVDENVQYRCNVSGKFEKNIRLSVEGQPENVTYQWKKKSADGDWNNIDGATSKEIDVKIDSEDATNQYSCEVLVSEETPEDERTED